MARTGDPVFQWSLVKILIKEKLQAVLSEFVETGGPVDVPPCPNVDLFDYDSMKEHVLKQLDAFVYPPFTIQRICELLAAPRKEYNRVDKYMRAIEKNVLVVSASDLSMKRALESDANESVINGILYDKVNDSLTTFTNHVFATASDEHEDELVAAKIDATDAVQRIIDESWNEETAAADEFKLNGSGSFEQELQQFVATEKAADDVDDAKPEPSSSSDPETSSSSFEETSMQPSLQNIIAEGTSITFENVAVAKEDDESPEPANDTYEFKDDSLDSSNVDLAPAESSEATPVDVVDHGSQNEQEFVDCQPEEPSTTTLEMMAVASDVPSEPMAADSFEDAVEVQPESTSVEATSAECSFGEDYQPNMRTEMDDNGWITYSAGDFQADADQPEEEQQESDTVSKVVPEESSQPSQAETEVEPETTTTEMETSQSAE